MLYAKLLQNVLQRIQVWHVGKRPDKLLVKYIFPTRSKLFKQVICGSFFMHQQPKKLILRHIIFDSWVVLTCICHNDCIYMPIMYLPVTESIGCIIKYFKLNIDHCPVAVLFYVWLQLSVKASNSLYHKITCHKYRWNRWLHDNPGGCGPE